MARKRNSRARRRKRVPGGPVKLGHLRLTAGIGKGGFLTLRTAGDPFLMTVDLSGRHARVLVALIEAFDEDAGVEVAARGWRTTAQLVSMIVEQDKFTLPVSPSTISAYLRQIKKIIAAATPSGQPPVVFERRKSFGVRLVGKVQLIVKDAKP